MEFLKLPCYDWLAGWRQWRSWAIGGRRDQPILQPLLPIWAKSKPSCGQRISIFSIEIMRQAFEERFLEYHLSLEWSTWVWSHQTTVSELLSLPNVSKKAMEMKGYTWWWIYHVIFCREEAEVVFSNGARLWCPWKYLLLSYATDLDNSWKRLFADSRPSWKTNRKDPKQWATRIFS